MYPKIKIAVPFDYTEVSLNALRYALKLFPESEIFVVHAYTGLTVNSPMSLHPFTPRIESIYGDLTEILLTDQEWDALPKNIQLVVVEGPVVQALNQYFTENDFAAVVMGTRDKYDLFDKWMGTVSLGIIKNASIPVYLIPRYATYKGFEKVLVASDYHLKDGAIVEKIKNWNTQRAYLQFIHIETTANEKFKSESQAIVENLFAKGDPDFTFEVATVVGQSVSESLLALAYNCKADLLIVFPEDQSYMETLLFKTLSKKLIIKSNIPLLFFK